MSFQLVVQPNSEEFAVFRSSAVKRAAAAAMRKAGSSALRAMRADGKRRVRSRKRIKAEYLANRGLPLDYPSRSADIDAMVWTMHVHGKEVPLGKYPARQTKRGVSVQVNKGGKRTLIRGAFIAQMRSGHVGVFMREGRRRLPIQHALSTRTSDVFQDRGMADAVLGRGATVLYSGFRRLMPLELDRVRR